MASLLASHQPPEGSYRILFNPGLEAEPAWIKPEVFQVENLLNFSYDDDDKIKLITGFTAINYNCKPENPNIIKDAEKRSEQMYKGQSDEVLEEDTEYYQFALTKELEWQDDFMQEGTCLNYSHLKLPEERRRGGCSPNSVLLGHSQCQVEQYTTTRKEEEEEEGKKCFRPCFHSARKIIAGSKARSKRARPSSSGARAWSYLTPILHHHNTFIPSLSAILTEFESQSSCTALEVDKEDDDENEGDEDERYVHDFLPPTKRAKKAAKKVRRFSNEVGQHQVSPTNNSTSTTTTITTTNTTTTTTTTRRCSHCLTQKTPQWRAGPEGPKTLCNACGVRYKSGRLLPEYRPAGSPTFVSWVHSNSHRKILEMRKLRQEEDTDPLRSPSPRTHQHHQLQGGGSNNIVVISDSIGVTTDST